MNLKKLARPISFLALILLSALLSGCGDSSNSSGSPSSLPSNSHKSARQLIKDYAKERYGNGADVTVDGPMYGNSYQVLVRTRIVSGEYAGGIDDATYTATVNTSSQEITSWELVNHN